MAPRLAFVYEHRHPGSVGGAERYYDALTRELGREQAVTYLTRRGSGGPRAVREGGVEVIGLSRPQRAGAGLLGRSVAKLRFAGALAWHLARRGGRYDVVHCASFPHVAPLAARIGLVPHRRTRLVVDWHEVLPRAAWRERLGPRGEIGYLVQRLALSAGDAAVAYSRLHAGRVADARGSPRVELLPEFPPETPLPGAAERGRERLIVFAGRLVPEKRAHLVPAVLAELRHTGEDWRAVVFGEGPEAGRVAAAARDAGVAEALAMPGFASWEDVADAMLRARALVRARDNAAVELVEQGLPGVVCESADPREQARAVLALAADAEAPRRTRAWFERERERFSAPNAARRHRELHAALLAAR